MNKDSAKVKTTSADMVADNLSKLRQVFPQFVKEDVIDFDALKNFFDKQNILAGSEKYGLNWAGRSDAFKAIRVPSTGTLTPEPEKSKNWDETGNIFIEGDNLEVLKLLQKHYREKIKMIYIDPPYNTGKDFVYKDNFTQGVADYYEQTGQVKDGIRMSTNTEKNGRYHSDWITMMYPRLFLARNLLRDDGVILVSIDDNELANLRLILEEIFGESNIEVLIWNKEAEGSSGTLKQTSTVRRVHEYIICAYKNYDQIQFTKVKEALLGKESELQTANLAVNFENEKVDHKNYFTITNPSGEKFTRQWKWSESEINKLIKENLIYWGSDGHKQPRLIIPTDERRTTFLLSILNYAGTTIGRKDFEEIMGDKIEFSYPKPILLLKKLIETASTNNSVVLDFFAGSGTTGQAVMDLNAEDGGNRKWICVQLPEETDEKSEAYKAGYKNIAEISRERIRRAGEKIGKGDVGFKSYKLSQSNYRQWQNLTDGNSEEDLKKQTKLFMEKPLTDDYNERSVVYEIMIKEGFGLNSVIKEPEKGSKFPLWVVINEGESPKKMVITFAKKITPEDVAKTGVGETNNEIFVCFDSALDDTTKINLIRNLIIKTI